MQGSATGRGREGSKWAFAKRKSETSLTFSILSSSSSRGFDCSQVVRLSGFSRVVLQTNPNEKCAESTVAPDDLRVSSSSIEPTVSSSSDTPANAL